MQLEWFDTSEGRIYGPRYSSADGQYFAIAQGDGYCNGKFERGRCWLYGPAGELFSPPKTVRPRRIAVANTGTMIVGDFLENTGALHSRITVFASNGEVLFEKRFRRNCTQVAISPEGNIAIVGIANPGNCIHVIGVAERNAVAKIEGHGWFNNAVISESSRSIVVDGEHHLGW